MKQYNLKLSVIAGVLAVTSLNTLASDDITQDLSFINPNQGLYLSGGSNPFTQAFYQSPLLTKQPFAQHGFSLNGFPITKYFKYLPNFILQQQLVQRNRDSLLLNSASQYSKFLHFDLTGSLVPQKSLSLIFNDRSLKGLELQTQYQLNPSYLGQLYLSFNRFNKSSSFIISPQLNITNQDSNLELGAWYSVIKNQAPEFIYSSHYLQENSEAIRNQLVPLDNPEYGSFKQLRVYALYDGKISQNSYLLAGAQFLSQQDFYNQYDVNLSPVIKHKYYVNKISFKENGSKQYNLFAAIVTNKKIANWDFTNESRLSYLSSNYSLDQGTQTLVLPINTAAIDIVLGTLTTNSYQQLELSSNSSFSNKSWTLWNRTAINSFKFNEQISYPDEEDYDPVEQQLKGHGFNFELGATNKHFSFAQPWIKVGHYQQLSNSYYYKLVPVNFAELGLQGTYKDRINYQISYSLNQEAATNIDEVINNKKQTYSNATAWVSYNANPSSKITISWSKLQLVDFFDVNNKKYPRGYKLIKTRWDKQYQLNFKDFALSSTIEINNQSSLVSNIKGSDYAFGELTTINGAFNLTSFINGLPIKFLLEFRNLTNARSPATCNRIQSFCSLNQARSIWLKTTIYF